MRVFQIIFTLIWLVVVLITLVVIRKEGIAASADIFSADLSALNWRSQFNADLLAHMLLIGFWAAWRQAFKLKGIVAGLLCALGGSLFSLVFIVVLSAKNNGDMKKILLGVHAK